MYNRFSIRVSVFDNGQDLAAASYNNVDPVQMSGRARALFGAESYQIMLLRSQSEDSII